LVSQSPRWPEVALWGLIGVGEKNWEGPREERGHDELIPEMVTQLGRGEKERKSFGD